MTKLSEQAVMEFLEEAWNNLLWDGMEAVLYRDGDNWIRQRGSFGVYEEEIVYTLSLDTNYWIDSYVIKTNEGDDVVTDEDMKKNFMEDMFQEISQKIEVE